MTVLVCAVPGSPVVAGCGVAAVPRGAPPAAARVSLAGMEMALASSGRLPRNVRPVAGVYHTPERPAAHCHTLGR